MISPFTIVTKCQYFCCGILFVKRSAILINRKVTEG